MLGRGANDKSYNPKYYRLPIFNFLVDVLSSFIMFVDDEHQ